MTSGRIVLKAKQQKIILNDFIASLGKNHNLKIKFNVLLVMENLFHQKSTVLRKNQGGRAEEENKTSKPLLKKVNISLFQRVELFAFVEDPMKAKMT